MVALPPHSRPLLAWFRWYARRYLARHFHAVRIARDGLPPPDRGGSLLIAMNHASWWDPLVALRLADFFPDRAHFAPMDADAWRRYVLLSRLGLFPLDRTSAAGVRRYLRTASAILAHPGAALWVTGQGRYADVRERPARLQLGVGRVACAAGSGTVLPLAVEYAFWAESKPEVLCRFGAPIHLGARSSPLEWTVRIAAALERTQDDLATQVVARDPGPFREIHAGTSGVGGAYDLWGRLRTTARGDLRPEAAT
jgi:1-acyl-sn-glycerol-3-phosphate acyltransferase